jgi:hypothetical protein
MPFETPPFQPPAYDAPREVFTFAPDKRDDALAWARGCIADIADRSDEELISACRIIKANDSAYHLFAAQLQKVLEDSMTVRARKAVGNA